MAFYPHVNPGEKFIPNCRLENDVRDMVNSFHGQGALPSAGVRENRLTVTVYNATEEELPSGCAVSIAGDSDVGELMELPCRRFDGDTLHTWGVLVKELRPGESGACVIAGILSVPLDAAPGSSELCHVMPCLQDDGIQSFSLAPAGAKVIGMSGDQAVVELGGGDDYHGYFKVALTRLSSGSGVPSPEEESSSSEEIGRAHV